MLLSPPYVFFQKLNHSPRRIVVDVFVIAIRHRIAANVYFRTAIELSTVPAVSCFGVNIPLDRCAGGLYCTNLRNALAGRCFLVQFTQQYQEWTIDIGLNDFVGSSGQRHDRAATRIKRYGGDETLCGCQRSSPALAARKNAYHRGPRITGKRNPIFIDEVEFSKMLGGLQSVPNTPREIHPRLWRITDRVNAAWAKTIDEKHRITV